MNNSIEKVVVSSCGALNTADYFDELNSAHIL